ncbi:CaiB/BaiF CoA transferase family protein [Aquirhabdus sp.]|uniref:CaiB/BaiF CoA transferase family protein n=1 Tax=Aquirhabdus sp. TaxID=2824160 RepID=UPI00396C6344
MVNQSLPPLSGLKILDFSTLLPGPFATLMLADLGADVIHVESPSRMDLVRIMPPYADGQATAHAYLNRNKRSVAMDLKDPANIQKIKELVSEYDIIVEQFRPNVMARLGLDYEALSKINPRLIYCSITGYGQTGSYKDRAGHDINYISLSGIAGHSGRINERPPAMGIQIADVAGGSLHAVIGILAAVIERQTSGQGQHVDISMTDCAFSLNTMAGAAQVAGGEQQGPEQGMLNGATFYDYYQTQDGRHISIGSLEPQFLMGLAQALALPEILSLGSSLQPEDRASVRAMIQKAIAEHSFEYWNQLFAALDVCVEPVLSLAEAVNSKLATERGWLVEVPLALDQPQTQKQLAHPIKYSRSQPVYRFMGRAVGADEV